MYIEVISNFTVYTGWNRKRLKLKAENPMDNQMCFFTEKVMQRFLLYK